MRPAPGQGGPERVGEPSKAAAIASGSSLPAASQSTLGTAVLGAVMTAKISSLLPASWHAAHLPTLTAGQLDQV